MDRLDHFDINKIFLNYVKLNSVTELCIGSGRLHQQQPTWKTMTIRSNRITFIVGRLGVAFARFTADQFIFTKIMEGCSVRILKSRYSMNSPSDIHFKSNKISELKKWIISCDSKENQRKFSINSRDTNFLKMWRKILQR